MAKRQKYARIGGDHLSLAFTYAWTAITEPHALGFRRWLCYLESQVR